MEPWGALIFRGVIRSPLETPFFPIGGGGGGAVGRVFLSPPEVFFPPLRGGGGKKALGGRRGPKNGLWPGKTFAA